MQIRRVELKLNEELNNIRTQLHEIGRACTEAEKIFDTPTPASKRADAADSEGYECESSSEPGSESGHAYFIIDDVVKYKVIVKLLIVRLLTNRIESNFWTNRVRFVGEISHSLRCESN